MVGMDMGRITIDQLVRYYRMLEKWITIEGQTRLESITIEKQR
jgi:hypothetical protein